MDDSLHAIDMYWRAANFTTVSLMYLKTGSRPDVSLTDSDMRMFVSGHWGTSPGINFIMAHLNRYITKYGRKVQLVIGPGHAGCALQANLLLEDVRGDCLQNGGESGKAEYTDEAVSVMRTEINPSYPGTIYDGGELGYSLSVAFGSVMDNPDLITVCIIGDGETETGALSSSWVCNYLAGNSAGKVLPVIHLNGYKMGGRSLLSYKSNEELICLFTGLGYDPIIVEAKHDAMFNALDRAESIYAGNQNHPLPLIVFRSPKGWTAPAYDGTDIEGRQHSHKNPLDSVPDRDKRRAYIQHWLDSYHPDELFDEQGQLVDDARAVIPPDTLKMGHSLHWYHRTGLTLPDVADYLLINHHGSYRNVKILEAYLADVIRHNASVFRVFSPDELTSNLLGGLLQREGDVIPKNGRVTEILNEHVCQGLMQGYTATGRQGVMISYEAFMPVITSMVSQYGKWLYQQRKVPWRRTMPSLNYILTSVCWANTYSHQNPEFINSLVSNHLDFVRIYLPPDANSLLLCLEQCLHSEGRINTVIASKQALPQWLECKDIQKGLEDGVVAWDWLPGSDMVHPDIVFVAAGDHMVEESLAAIEEVQKIYPNLVFSFLTVFELTSLGSPAIYPHAMSQKKFGDYFTQGVPAVFAFHGFPSAVKMLLFDRDVDDDFAIMGYINKSITSTNTLNKMILNQCSRYHIAMQALIFLHKNKKIKSLCFNDGMACFEEQIQRCLDEGVS